MASLNESEIENPDSLQRFYDLLRSVLRVINAVVLSRGPQNTQTVKLAQQFVTTNRASIVAVLKRHAKIGGVHANSSGDLDDLVDCYVLLLTTSKFLEVILGFVPCSPTPNHSNKFQLDEQAAMPRSSGMLFT